MTRRTVLLLLACLIAGCQVPPVAQVQTPSAVAPTQSPSPTASPASVAAGLTSQPFGEATIDAAVEVLAESGVATYADATSAQPIQPPTEPRLPLKYMRDEVRAMALEANAGGGIEGAELDALVDTPPDLAPPSYIVGGYVAAVQTDGAAVARALMGDKDWHDAPHVVFPQVVLALFTADIVRERMSEVQANGLTAPFAVPAVARIAQTGFAGPPIRAAATGPCSAVSNFITDTLKAVFDALRLGEPSSGIGAIFTSIWNFVVSTLETVVTAIVKKFTQQVLDAIGRVAAIVGTVSVIVSAIRPWTVTVKPDPQATEKGIAGGRPPDHGRLVARVDLGGLDEWPSWAQDCATVAGQPLPNLKPEGTPITWEPVVQLPPALMAEDSHQDKLDANGAAELDFTTLVDAVNDPYQTFPGSIYAHVTLERQSLKDLAQMAKSALFAELPSIVAGALQAFLGPSIQNVIDSLGKLITVEASGPAVILFHVQQETPPPSPQTEPPPQQNKDQFCTLYRAYLDWAQANSSGDITQALAAEIAQRFGEMRPVAPAQLLADVDLMIKVYGTYATVPEPYNLPMVGPDAAAIPGALMAMNSYCGIAIPGLP